MGSSAVVPSKRQALSARPRVANDSLARDSARLDGLPDVSVALCVWDRPSPATRREAWVGETPARFCGQWSIKLVLLILLTRKAARFFLAPDAAVAAGAAKV